eukprot:scaffold30048_cov56-Attheya_sp.AAC.2
MFPRCWPCTCDLVDRRSMAAQFHFLFGVATDWKIGKRLATAAHSTDAELCSMFTAVKSTLAIRAFVMMHLRYGPPKPTRHHEDNQPTVLTLYRPIKSLVPGSDIFIFPCVTFIINWIVVIFVPYSAKALSCVQTLYQTSCWSITQPTFRCNPWSTIRTTH